MYKRTSITSSRLLLLLLNYVSTRTVTSILIILCFISLSTMMVIIIPSASSMSLTVEAFHVFSSSRGRGRFVIGQQQQQQEEEEVKTRQLYDYSSINNINSSSSSSSSKSSTMLKVAQIPQPPINQQHNNDNQNISNKFTNLHDIEEMITSNIQPTSYTINVEAEASSTIMKRKIVNLLRDDDGEEDDEIPDYSEEAANEIAEKSSYSRISEEAKLKANYAVQKELKKNDVIRKNNYNRDYNDSDIVNNDDSDYSDVDFNNEQSNEFDSFKTKTQKRRRFTASVKETGVDTMSQYVKSMGSHELLPKDSEILLGKQIQILVSWEQTRQELEETLSK